MSPGRSPIIDVIRIVLPILILAGGVGGFLALGGRRPMETRQEESAKSPLVETALVEPHQRELEILVDGLVVPSREIKLSAEIAGRIIHKADACRAGKYATKGTVLIEIDPRDYDLEARRLQKELQQAEVSLAELDVEEQNTQGLVKLAKDTLELELKEVERLRKLVEKDYVTDSQMDAELRNELTARNALLTLENQLRSIKTRRSRLEGARDFVAVRLEKAELDRTRTKITMPVDGMIVEDLVEQNGYVAPGTAVAMIEDTSTVEVKCSLQMDELYWLWNQKGDESNGSASQGPRTDYQIPRAPVTVIYTLAGEDYAWDGVLSRYEGVGLDEATRMVPCRVSVANPRAVRSLGAKTSPPSSSRSVGPPALVRGMYVTVRIHAKPEAELLSISERAVRPGNKVWRVRDNKLNIVPIHVVSIMNDIAAVRPVAGNLVAGDKVVVTPLALVEDGMAVREEEKR